MVDRRGFAGIIKRSPELRQRKYNHGLLTPLIGIRNSGASVRGRDRAVLLAVLPLIRHRHCNRVVIELRLPKLLTGPRIDRAESLVVGCADEHQPPGRYDRAAESDPPGVLLAFR